MTLVLLLCAQQADPASSSAAPAPPVRPVAGVDDAEDDEDDEDDVVEAGPTRLPPARGAPRALGPLKPPAPVTLPLMDPPPEPAPETPPSACVVAGSAFAIGSLIAGAVALSEARPPNNGNNGEEFVPNNLPTGATLGCCAAGCLTPTVGGLAAGATPRDGGGVFAVLAGGVLGSLAGAFAGAGAGLYTANSQLKVQTSSEAVVTYTTVGMFTGAMLGGVGGVAIAAILTDPAFDHR